MDANTRNTVAAAKAVTALATIVAALMLVMSCSFAGRAYAAETFLQVGEIVSGDTADSGDDAASDDDSASGSIPDPAADPDPVVDPEPEPHVDGWEYAERAWHYWKGNEMCRSRWVVTSTPPAIEGISAGKHRYWIAADGTLARRRLIDTSRSRDKAAGYCAYATKYGYVATGKKVVGDKVYLARANGRLETGNTQGILDVKRYDNGTKRRYYIDKKAHAAITGQVVKVKGWGKVYAYPKKGYIARGITKFDGTHLLIADADGRLCQREGWVTTSAYAGEKQRYYLEPTKKNKGVYGARTGLFKVAGWGEAYAYPNTGYIARGITTFDSTHVLVADGEGRLCQKKGWVVTKKYDSLLQRYYFEPTAKNKGVYGARIGKFRVDGKLYYGVEGYGYEFRNAYKQIGSSYYWADNDGVLTWNSVITRMYQRAQGYASPSRYLIMVDTDDTKFMVLEGAQGNWKVKFIWDCSTGAPETPTVLGVYHVGIKGYSFGHGYTCYYYTQFYGDYLIHTRIYQEGTHILRDAAMNTRVSQGCVRLYDEDAYWVWRNVPEGTTVVTIV